MKKYRLRSARVAIVALLFVMGTAMSMSAVAKDDEVRVAFIEGLSGPFATLGEAALQGFEYTAEEINANGGIQGKKVVIVPFDNKTNAQESLQILKEVADRGIQYITQGNGSHVAAALISGVDKHNRRNPDKQIVFLNYSAVDPALTNDKCSFWHFRFDINSEMKLNALTNFIAEHDEFQKVFVIGQDYSHGQFISKTVPEMLAEKAPGVEVVGNTLHPVGRVKDFSPYISKIAGSDADVVVTGNWGRDLTLLVRAGEQAGLDAKWLTYYGGVAGAPTAIGEKGADNVYVVSEWHENIAATRDLKHMQKLTDGFNERYGIDFSVLRIRTELMALKKAMEKAGTTEPKAVAYALEGLKMQTPGGKAYMRTSDHQFMQPLFISKFTKDFPKYDAEGTGLGWVTEHEMSAEATALPTSCEMQRPPKS